MLFERDSREQGGFEAMGGAGANDAAEAPHRIARWLIVVRKVVEPPLHRGRRAKPLDELSLGRGEREVGRIDPGITRCVGSDRSSPQHLEVVQRRNYELPAKRAMVCERNATTDADDQCSHAGNAILEADTGIYYLLSRFLTCDRPYCLHLYQ